MPNETLSLCKHKHPIKFSECMKCLEEGAKIIENMNKKEETITIKKALWDEMLAYKNKTNNLVARFNKLEQLVDDFIRSANGRIEELFRHKNYQTDENRTEARLIEELEERIKKLESNKNEDLLYYIISNKKPHKCPNCYGRGFKEDMHILHREECISCEGKGILWN